MNNSTEPLNKSEVPRGTRMCECCKRTTAWMQEVEQRRERLPRSGAFAFSFSYIFFFKHATTDPTPAQVDRRFASFLR